MKVIVNVETIETTVPYGTGNTVKIVNNGKLENEEIVCRTFLNNRGEKIAIGMTKDVQDFIGLPFDYFEKIINMNELLMKSFTATVEVVHEQCNALSMLNHASFFQRLQFLFMGKININFLTKGK